MKVIPAGPRLDLATSGKEGKAFFSEEKKQKTFVPAVAEISAACARGNKSFLVLLKKGLLALTFTGQGFGLLV